MREGAQSPPVFKRWPGARSRHRGGVRASDTPECTRGPQGHVRAGTASVGPVHDGTRCSAAGTSGDDETSFLDSLGPTAFRRDMMSNDRRRREAAGERRDELSRRERKRVPSRARLTCAHDEGGQCAAHRGARVHARACGTSRVSRRDAQGPTCPARGRPPGPARPHVPVRPLCGTVLRARGPSKLIVASSKRREELERAREGRGGGPRGGGGEDEDAPALPLQQSPPALLQARLVPSRTSSKGVHQSTSRRRCRERSVDEVR